MMILEKRKRKLVEEIRLIPDPYERLGYLVERGKKAKELGADLRIDSFKIEGCLSQLWIVPKFKEGRCHFHSDSDSVIVKGIANMLCDFYSDATPEEIVKTDAHFLGEVGITQHLSPNRRNGLSRIVESIQRFARSCLRDSSS